MSLLCALPRPLQRDSFVRGKLFKKRIKAFAVRLCDNGGGVGRMFESHRGNLFHNTLGAHNVDNVLKQTLALAAGRIGPQQPAWKLDSS